MDTLDALINIHGTDNEVIFLGDFNADPGPESGPRSYLTLTSKGAFLRVTSVVGDTAHPIFISTTAYCHIRTLVRPTEQNPQ